jgi:hypothetical protein
MPTWSNSFIARLPSVSPPRPHVQLGHAREPSRPGAAVSDRPWTCRIIPLTLANGAGVMLDGGEGQTMTEAEWLACTDPQPMLEVVWEKASDRRLRLFGCACVRRVWDLLLEEQSRTLVEVGELYADGFVDEQELSKDRQSSDDYLHDVDGGGSELVLPETEASHAACEVADRGAGIFTALYASRYASSAREEGGREQAERAAQAALLRDIFGPLPFRPAAVSPAWQTPTMRVLAQGAYDQRELPAGSFDVARLAVLADALEEAGCTDQDILTHLRGPGPHVRGCWVVDLLLGKS